ncbi:hypothetical protein F4677DRAFT_404300 [Hypoxylon crocopeplum]|nr:hypothetical protein F4677DRAFT_404300 [Hypoxylon crocopeplum]
MANDSRSYLCGLLCARARPAPRQTRDDNNLRGVEFSPRSSVASSRTPAPPLAMPSSASTTPPAANLTNPELAGYYSPPAPQTQLLPDPSLELRGYYAPQAAAPTPRPSARPPKPSYFA